MPFGLIYINSLKILLTTKPKTIRNTTTIPPNTIPLALPNCSLGNGKMGRSMT